MKTEQEIKIRIDELNKKENILREYLQTIYKNSYPKEKIDSLNLLYSLEVMYIVREKAALAWVLGLPF